MSRKHFVKLAAGVKGMTGPKTQKYRTAKMLVEICKSENPRFNADRFYKACGL